MRKRQDWIESFLQYTDNSEPPEIFREWVAVSTIAAVLQRKCFLPWGEITFYPNMYIVLVAPSGKCRKGTAMDVGSKFLRSQGINIAAEAITREALIRELAGSSAIHTDDTGRSITHCSLTVFSKELTVFLGYDNKTLISDLTDWYDCGTTWTYRTKGSGTDEIINTWVNIIGATTPDLVRNALPSDAIGGGLASRIIFVYADQKGKTVPAPFLTPKDFVLRNDLETDLENISLLSGPFNFTQEFLDQYIEWYTEAESNPPFQTNGHFAGYVERRPTHLLKLCIILSASEREDRLITGKVFDRALALLIRTEIAMPKTFAGYGRAARADTMNKIMAFIGTKQKTTRTDIFQAFMMDLENSKELDDILISIQQVGFCTLTYKGNETYVTYKKGLRP